MTKKIMGYIATNTHTKEQLPILRSLYDCVMMIVTQGGQTHSKLACGSVTGKEADEIKLRVFSAWEIAEATAEIDAPEDRDWDSCSMEASALHAWKPTAGAYVFALSTSVVNNFHPFGKYRVE